jgi:hypothetical protein
MLLIILPAFYSYSTTSSSTLKWRRFEAANNIKKKHKKGIVGITCRRIQKIYPTIL